MLVYICGVPGVGKTTITKQIALLSQSVLKIERVEVYPILNELANNEGVDYNVLKKNERRPFQIKMFQKIHEIDQENPTTIRLLDRHLSSFNFETKSGKIWKIRPDDSKQIIALVVLVADPVIIHKRRLQDQVMRPDRDIRSIGLIKYLQCIEVATVFNQARKLKIPITITGNKDGTINELSKKLHSFIIQQYKNRQ